MTEQEIERCLERFAMGKATDIMNFDYVETLAYIRKLKSENAALKARLDKALPCKVGDIIYTVTFSLFDGYDDNDNLVSKCGYLLDETRVTEKNLYQACDLIHRGKAALTYEGAVEIYKKLQNNEN